MKKLKSVRIKNSDKLNLIISLRTMLVAGIPLLEIVELLALDAKGGLKIFLDTLEADLLQGKTISSTMVKFPSIFDKVTVSVLKAAEESGTLESSLKDVQDNILKEIQFNDKIRAAALYPAVVIVVFWLVMITILVFVIPRVAKVFTALKIELPLPTKILLFASNALLYQLVWVLLGLAVILSIAAFLYFRRREWLLNAFFSLPIIKTIVREIDLTRFSRSMALLMASGLPITSCLELAKEVIIQKEVRVTITDAEEMVISGKRLSESFKKYKKIYPPIMVKLIEAGEKSGTLEELMQFVYEHMEYQVQKRLATVSTLIEPVLLIVIGLIIGSIMLSIVGPIYSLIGQIGPK